MGEGLAKRENVRRTEGGGEGTQQRSNVAPLRAANKRTGSSPSTATGTIPGTHVMPLSCSRGSVWIWGGWMDEGCTV